MCRKADRQRQESFATAHLKGLLRHNYADCLRRLGDKGPVYLSLSAPSLCFLGVQSFDLEGYRDPRDQLFCDILQNCAGRRGSSGANLWGVN